MRRTLAVLVTTAALLVPATAASAAPNASCNNDKGGNYERTGQAYNGKGHAAGDCRGGGGGGGTT